MLFRSRVRDGREGRVVDALEAVRAVEAGALLEDRGVVGGVGADDHLRGRSEERRVGKEGRSRLSPYH